MFGSLLFALAAAVNKNFPAVPSWAAIHHPKKRALTQDASTFKRGMFPTPSQHLQIMKHLGEGLVQMPFVWEKASISLQLMVTVLSLPTWVACSIFLPPTVLSSPRSSEPRVISKNVISPTKALPPCLDGTQLLELRKRRDHERWSRLMSRGTCPQITARRLLQLAWRASPPARC